MFTHRRRSIVLAATLPALALFACAAWAVDRCQNQVHDFFGGYQCIPLDTCNSVACGQIGQVCIVCTETLAQSMCVSMSEGHNCTHTRTSNGCGGIGSGMCTLVGSSGQCLFVDISNPSEPCCRTSCSG